MFNFLVKDPHAASAKLRSPNRVGFRGLSRASLLPFLRNRS